jgi:hypothetical protein
MAACALFVALALGAGDDALAGEQVQKLVYAIEHPEHGDVGTFTNVIRRNGATVTVESRTDIKVKAAFLTLFRQASERREIWCAGRLMAYESVTEKNGDTTKVLGRAAGDKFVLKRGNRKFEAPAGIFPTNPWSKNITKTSQIISPVRGKIEQIRVRANGTKAIELGDRNIQAEHFAVGGDIALDIWYDRDGVLLKFTYPSDHDLLTFTLQNHRSQPVGSEVQTAACPAGDPFTASDLG